MPTIEKRNAPMNTEIDVCALRSPTISGTALGVVEAEALDRALTIVESEKTATVNRLEASTVRIDSTASDDNVNGNLSGTKPDITKAITTVRTATNENAAGRNHIFWTICRNLNAI